MNFKFKEQNPDPNKRRQESEKIREKYPDRVPIICEKAPNCKGLNNVDKSKYLVPNDLTVSQFSFIIRKRLEMSKDAALFLLVSGKHSITGDTSSEIYEKYADKDDVKNNSKTNLININILYISYLFIYIIYFIFYFIMKLQSILLLLIVNISICWWDTGHMLVAQVAQTILEIESKYK
jgi:GABA(A) receptor-associated protein